MSLDSWQVKFDPVLGQHYFLNENDNTISFDSPCEVKNPIGESKMKSGKFLGLIRKSSKNKCPQKKPPMLNRITTKLSLKKSRSNDDSVKTEPKTPESVIPPSTYDDFFLLNNPHDFNNFAGTSMVGQSSLAPSFHFASTDSSLYADSESESIDSLGLGSEEESVKSFYFEDNYTCKYPSTYTYNNYHYYYEENDAEIVEDEDVEAEKASLRMQMLAELE